MNKISYPKIRISGIYCRYCTFEIEKRRPGKIYCSKLCQRRDVSKRGYLKWKKKNKICRICFKEFKPYRKHFRICSKECYSLLRKRASLRVVIKRCLYCSKEFEGIKRKTFCSRTCSSLKWTKNNQEKLKEIRRKSYLRTKEKQRIEMIIEKAKGWYMHKDSNYNQDYKNLKGGTAKHNG